MILVSLFFLLCKEEVWFFNKDFHSQGQELQTGPWGTCGPDQGPSERENFLPLSSDLPDHRTRTENCNRRPEGFEKYLASNSLLFQEPLKPPTHEREKTHPWFLPSRKEVSREEVPFHLFYMQKEVCKSYLSFSP